MGDNTPDGVVKRNTDHQQMNDFPLYHYFIYNGEIKPNTEFRISENAGGVYEVIRVFSGIPLFLEEHLERFFISAALAGTRIQFTKKQIAGFIAELISLNLVSEGNVLISMKINLKAFFIPHKYPDEKYYLSGITCGLLHAERENPNAKVFRTSVRQMADEMIAKHGYYEVILIDFQNRITEGSRSNVFFVKKDILITPPAENVLLGITRQKVIRLAQDAGLTVHEQVVSLEDMQTIDSACITGTSPKVLPVAQFDRWKLNPQHEVVQGLRKKYDTLIADYVKSCRSSIPEK